MRHDLLALSVAGALAAPCLTQAAQAAIIMEDVLAAPRPNSGKPSYVQMVLDRDRRPHLVVDVLGPSLYYVTRTVVGGWSVSSVDSMDDPGRTACGGELGFGTLCAIALDVGERPVVTYYDPCPYSYGRRILSKRMGGAGSWSGPAQIVALDVHPINPMSLAVDGTGGAHLAYPATNRCHYVHRSADVWDIPESVVNASYAAPSLALDPSGAPLIAFNQANTVRLATRSSGAWTSSLVATPSSVGQVGAYPSLTTTSAGGLRIAMSSGDSLACAAKDNGVWAVDYGVAAGGGASRIALGSDGTLCVLHINRDNRLILSRTVNGNWVSSVVSDDPVSPDLSSHALAVDDLGRAHVVYQVNTGPSGDLILRYGVDSPAPTSVEDFGAPRPRGLSVVVRPEVLRSSGELAVHVSGSQAREGSAQLMDIAGRCVARRAVALAEGDSEFRWRVPVVRAGTYFLLVASGDRKGAGKVVFLP